jgi:hypothetical protein
MPPFFKRSLGSFLCVRFTMSTHTRSFDEGAAVVVVVVVRTFECVYELGEERNVFV